MADHLKVLKNGEVAQSWAIEGGMVSIGKSPSNKLVLDDPTVGPRHALFMQRDGAYTILDLGAESGTFVNERKISPKDGPQKLASGDKLKIGAFEVQCLFGGAGGGDNGGGAKAAEKPKAAAAAKPAEPKAPAPKPAEPKEPAPAPAPKAKPKPAAIKQTPSGSGAGSSDSEALGGGTVVMGDMNVQDAIGAAVAIRNANARLIVGLEGRQEIFPINGREIKIGREGDNHLNIGHPSISGAHCRIFWSGEGFSVEDVGSKNGTKVAENPIREGVSRKLKSHTALTLGAVPCLFVVDEFDGAGKKVAETDASRVIGYLVKKGWISKYQGSDAIKEEKGNTSAIAARFVSKSVVSPEQWAEAYQAATILQTQGGGGGGGSGKLVVAILIALILVIAVVGALLVALLKPGLFGLSGGN